MEAVVGALVGATVKVGLKAILSKISSVNSESTGSDYENDMTRLKNLLVLINQYLSDVGASQVQGEAVKEWLKQLEDVIFDADDVVDEVNYHLIRCQVENKNQNVNMVLKILSFIIDWCQNLGRSDEEKKNEVFRQKIVDAITNLERINKDAGWHNVKLEGQIKTMRVEGRETDSYSIEPNIEGRAKDVEYIVGLIKAPQVYNISVIPISGMGGVGKTTIARTVFNLEEIKSHFGKRIWLSVSLNFDALSLFKMILQDLTKEAVTVTSKEVVLQKIQEILINKEDKLPYLLILDDVWNEEEGKWDEFMVPLSNISRDLANGNWIVVTTRKETVASLVKIHRRDPTHKLSCLSDIQCWSIIKAIAFGGEDVPQEFENIGIDIAKKCDGLPLAAKVIGGLLRGQTEEYWRNILDQTLLDGDGDNIMKILRLSYDHLPTLYHKKCFAYCFVFPRGYTIRRQEIIELWMAEEFIKNDQGGDMETAGSKVFNCLLHCSLFQDEKRDFFGDIVDVKMHDFVHDLACSISKDVNQVRYLALNEPNVIISQMKYLRTMFSEGDIAHNMFSNFKSLHVLKLTLPPEIKEFPSGIEKLIHLRSLEISSTQVEQLPDSIGKLYHLQTLLLTSSQAELPNTITDLVSLRHLYISASTNLPPKIGKLNSLRTLNNYNVRDEDGHRIGELRSLKNLKGELKLGNLEMVKGKEEAEFADLSGKAGILKLTLEWNKSSDVGHHTNVLDGLQPHSRLKSLEITGYEDESLPSWTKSMATTACNNNEIRAFNNLVEIKLNGFTQCNELPTLGHLPNLKFLKLENWPKLESVGLSFYIIENETVFPALQRFEMDNMPSLTKWVEPISATMVFPCLKYLKIAKCPKLEIVHIPFPCLKYLKITECPKLVSVHSHFPCLEMFEVDVADIYLTDLVSNTKSLIHIELNSLAGLVVFPGELFVKNENLIFLQVADCPKLTDLVPSSPADATSLKFLRILCCETLRKLPDDLNTLCKLKILDIRNCKSLNLIPIGLLESTISSLDTLLLVNLENLENLDELIPCLARMSLLQRLFISNIPKFKFIPENIGCLASLRDLAIGKFSEPINVDQLTNILSKCPSLEQLGLFGTEQHYDTLVEMESVQRLSVRRL